MPGQSTHTKRRFSIGSFHNRYFVGRGLDVGGGHDALSVNAHPFALITGLEVWDTPQGDAQYLPGARKLRRGFFSDDNANVAWSDSRAVSVTRVASLIV